MCLKFNIKETFLYELKLVYKSFPYIKTNLKYQRIKYHPYFPKVVLSKG